MKTYLPTLLLRKGLLAVAFSVVSVLTAMPPAAHGQTAATPAASNQLQQHPLDQLQKTQPPPPETDEYQLGSGDEVNITVTGRTELSGTHVVGPDGMVTLPVSGSVKVDGLSREEAAKAIANSLKSLYTDPGVVVQVTKYGSNKVILLGDIEHPGVLYFDGTPTLLETITRGGSLVGDDKARRMPTSCIIYRGHDQIGSIDLREVFRSGDIRLHRNDIVYVPGDQEKLISVLGEVKTPGPIPLKESSTLVSVLADAGGITPQAGNPNVQIINPKTGSVQTVKFSELLTPRGKDVTLEVGDIVYIPRSGIAKVGFFLQQLAPAAQIGTIGAVIADR